MSLKIYPFAALLLFSVTASAQLTPEITSWILNTNNATGYHGIPTNVQQVQYSDDNVYVSATCIPGYDIGPWPGNPNVPVNQNFVYKITRHPVANNGQLIETGLGHIGVFSNGVSIFNPKDAMSYNNQDVWHQNAVVVEGPAFDDCLGHPAPNGEYHHHLNPTCLYGDSTSTSHSPIIGYAFDGFPVYGAYAFANADGTGGIKRMQSSYMKRDITVRTTLPDGTNASSPGPPVSSTYPLGYYVEDFEFINGSGDLDQHNGRFSVTPDYPEGIYCYFVTLDINLVAEFPYIIGTTYYGTVQAGNTGPFSGHNTITESVVTYNGPTATKYPIKEIAIDIFPNPTKDLLNIYIEQDMPNDLKLEIFNDMGQIVFQKENLQPTILYSVNLSDLPGGSYVVRIQSKESITTRIIVRE